MHLLMITQGRVYTTLLAWPPRYIGQVVAMHACKIIIIPLTSLGEIVLGISKSIIHSDASRTLPATWVEWGRKSSRRVHIETLLW